MEEWKRRQLDRMCHPRGLAVFGGVATPGSFGERSLLCQLRYGYQGRLYPISPKGGEVAGLKIYRSLSEVDGPVDLASISVRARAVPGVLRECLEHGVTGAQILSSGFAETGQPEGAALQEEISRTAGNGLRLLGPNCFGLHCPRGGVTILPGTNLEI